MKIFTDRAAQKRFWDLYQGMTETDQNKFSIACRKLADQKLNTEDDSVTEFYLTIKDVNALFMKI